MDESSSTDSKESLIARIQLLEHERDELKRDIEKICIQKAGPEYLNYATKMHFRRTAGLEQEIENLKKKVASYAKDNSNLKEELSEACYIKSQLAELHSSEIAKNLEMDKQLKFFQGCLAGAFAERDQAMMEAEKVKEKEELIAQELYDCRGRLEESTLECTRAQELLSSLQKDLVKLEHESELSKKVIYKFYEIRQQGLGAVEKGNGCWEDICPCLLDDPEEKWSFDSHREASAARCMSALQEELAASRSCIDNLQTELRVGLEIESHLRRKVSKLEHERSLINVGISSLRHCHNEQKIQIMELLLEGKSYMKLLTDELEEKFGLSDLSREEVLRLSKDAGKNDNNVKFSIDAETSASRSSFLRDDNDSEVFSQALEEKVSALVLLSQQEERHLLESNVHAALQKKVDELQRILLQVTNEKVEALMEVAHLKREYQLILERTNPSPWKEGKLKNVIKKTSILKRWIDSKFDGTDSSSHSSHEGYVSGRSSSGVDFARLQIDYVTLKENLASLEHLTSVIRKLRLNLMKAEEALTPAARGTARSLSKSLDDIISEAGRVKTALSSSLPVSWSAGRDSRLFGDDTTDMVGDSVDSTKINSVSAAGFEMVELLFLAARVMKDNVHQAVSPGI